MARIKNPSGEEQQHDEQGQGGGTSSSVTPRHTVQRTPNPTGTEQLEIIPETYGGEEEMEEEVVVSGETDLQTLLSQSLGVGVLPEETVTAFKRILENQDMALVNATVLTSVLEGFRGLREEVITLRNIISTSNNPTGTAQIGMAEYEKVQILLT